MRAWFVATALTALLATNGCAGAETQPTAADRAFVADMLPHHHLGIELIEEATVNSSDVRLRRLVFEMSGYHATQMDLLHQLSAKWKVPASIEFPGNLDTQEIGALSRLTGVSHDTWWLSIMIKHHNGAITIGNEAWKYARVMDVRKLANKVVFVQSREIVEMLDLLGELCAAHPGAAGCDA